MGGVQSEASVTDVARAATTIDYLEFDSTSSLIDPNGGELTDDSIIPVYAEDTATNEDADGSGDAVLYSGSTSIPLVAADGNVVGFGAQLVTNDANYQSGNEEFVLNVWDDLIGGGTVLYDEGHGSYNTLSSFSNMANYAENNGYTVNATSDISADLSGADAVMISSPGSAFTGSELTDLVNFVNNGGTVLLHDTSDYNNYDETANLNDIANELGVGFRFNDDQVLDDTNNGGVSYTPTTTQFDTSFNFFTDREGLELDSTKTYTVDVISVADGDTVDVRFDSGREETIRVLGIDTPEKNSNDSAELLHEWEGISDEPYLDTWGSNATTFAKDELSNQTVDISFDDEEPGIFDPFGRLLAYIDYDADGDGVRDEPYNYRAVQKGYARVYSSSFSRHDSYLSAELSARSNGRNVWQQSDPANSSEIRNRDVGDMFFPTPESVRTTGGAIDRSRVPVEAESSASQSGGSVSYSSNIPLVGVDEANNVAAVGSPLIDESYESNEGYAVDTSTYENFVFLTNLLDNLSSKSGKVLIDGGHAQFESSYALSSEDAAYYQRYLEGVDIQFDQVNTLSPTNLSNARALVITSPAESFTSTELSNLASFRDNGGAVILVGSSSADSTARSNLNAVASDLGTDLRLNGGSVSDSTNNVNSDSSVPTTTVFDTSFSLWSAYGSSGGGDGGGDGGSIQIKSIHEDAQGNDNNNLNDEYVVFENPDSSDIDLTGYAVEDEAGKHYDFPDNFTLAGGDTVTLHTGSGTDTDTDLYWGRGSPVWNNSGDTAFLFDDTGTQIDSLSTDGSGGGGGGSGGSINVKNVHEDAAGNDGDNLNDEYVVFENNDSSDLDLTGYAVEDEVGKHYDFPSGFTLAAGDTVTLHTGSGSDTSTDLYWGYGSPVWNNGGDTVYVFDDSGSTVETHSY
jgi:endonuclease YncB( thermonuclease family)